MLVCSEQGGQRPGNNADDSDHPDEFQGAGSRGREHQYRPEEDADHRLDVITEEG